MIIKLAGSLNFNIGGEAPGKLPWIDAGNNTSASYQSNFAALISRTMGFVMAIAAIALLLFLIWGALQWLTSGGDKSKLESARNRITQGVIGIVVLAAVTALFVTVQQFLGIKIINFVP